MLAILLLSTYGLHGVRERPLVADVVHDLIGGETESAYRDDGYGMPIPFPNKKVRRATCFLLVDPDERRRTFTFDDEGRVVHDTKYQPFNGPIEVETDCEYGPFGLVSVTGKSIYDYGSYSWRGEYDADGRLIGSESGSSRGTWRRTMLLDSERSDEVLLSESNNWSGDCVDLLHRMVMDAEGRVLRHEVHSDGGSYDASDFTIDDEGRWTRELYSFRMGGPVFTHTVERSGDVTSVATWGEYGELCDRVETRALGSGTWIEIDSVHRNEKWLRLIDSQDRIQREIFVDRDATAWVEEWHYTIDAWGNVLECRRTTIAPKPKHSFRFGYRWEVEYR